VRARVRTGPGCAVVVPGMLQPRRSQGKFSGKLQDPGSIETVLLTCDWTSYVCAALSASNMSLEVKYAALPHALCFIEMLIGSEATMCSI